MPGHQPDHMCFYFQPEKVFFSGDFVLGRSSTLILDIEQQLRSLRKCLQMDISILAPGHGPVVYGADKVKQALQHNIDHIRSRLDKIFNAIKGKGEVTTLALLKEVYPKITPPQWRGACYNIHSHIQYLQKSGKITIESQTPEKVTTGQGQTLDVTKYRFKTG